MTDFKFSHHSYKVEKVEGGDTYYRLEGEDSHPILTKIICIDSSDSSLERILEPDCFLWTCRSAECELTDWIADMYMSLRSDVYFGILRFEGVDILIVLRFCLNEKSLVIDFYDNCLPTKSEIKVILEKYI